MPYCLSILPCILQLLCRPAKKKWKSSKTNRWEERTNLRRLLERVFCFFHCVVSLCRVRALLQTMNQLLPRRTRCKCGHRVCAFAQLTQKGCDCAFTGQLEFFVQSAPETLATLTPGEDSSQAVAKGTNTPRTPR